MSWPDNVLFSQLTGNLESQLKVDSKIYKNENYV